MLSGGIEKDQWHEINYRLMEASVIVSEKLHSGMNEFKKKQGAVRR